MNFHTNLYNTVSDFFECAVIWSHQNAPRPELPYVTLHQTAFAFLDMPEILPVNEEGERYTRQFARISVSIQYMGEDAAHQLTAFHMMLMANAPIGNAVKDAGLVSFSGVASIPELEENIWVDRALYEPEFLVEIRSEKIEVGFIDQAEINPEEPEEEEV